MSGMVQVAVAGDVAEAEEIRIFFATPVSTRRRSSRRKRTLTVLVPEAELERRRTRSRPSPTPTT